MTGSDRRTRTREAIKIRQLPLFVIHSHRRPASSRQQHRVSLSSHLLLSTQHSAHAVVLIKRGVIQRVTLRLDLPSSRDDVFGIQFSSMSRSSVFVATATLTSPNNTDTPRQPGAVDHSNRRQTRTFRCQSRNLRGKGMVAVVSRHGVVYPQLTALLMVQRRGHHPGEGVRARHGVVAYARFRVVDRGGLERKRRRIRV